MRLRYWFLHLLILLGFLETAFELSEEWANSGDPYLSNVAWDAQQLLTKRGFHVCSECGWAMRQPNEHVESGKGWCYEQANWKPTSGYVDLEEDEQILVLSSDDDEEVPQIF